MMRKLSSLGVTSNTDITNRDKIYSGYLYKQGSMFNKKFQKRYFVLFEGRVLVYYASDIAKEAKGEIDLSTVIGINESKIKISDTNIYQHVFELKTKDRIYILSSPDIKSMNSWMDYIRSTVFGTKIHEGWLTKQGDFVKSWKRRYFVLTDTKLLRYFEDEEQTKCKGIINVQHIQSITEGEPVEPYWNFMINLQCPDRLWLLNADSEPKRQEWLNMLDEGKKTINYDASAALFVDINQNIDHYGIDCKTNQRIKYIINLYEKWCEGNKQFQTNNLSLSSNKSSNKTIKRTISTGFKAAGTNKSKGIWEIINNDLKDYSNVQLLNDFNFLLQNFGAKRNKFLEFYHYILGEKQENPSVPPQESLILIRNIRNKLFYSKYNIQRRMLYNNSIDIKEINTQNLLDRMYSFIMYSYNTLSIDPIEWQRIKDYDETDKLVTSKQMLNEKKLWMKQAKKIYRINERTKKFMIDVYENIITEKKKEKKEEEEEKKNDNDNDSDSDNDDEFIKIPNNFNRLDVNFKCDEKTETEYFQFGGEEFVYWDDCKQNEWFISKQYENLKEEITTNKLCIISMEQWDDLYESASNISESNKASEFLSYDGLGNNINCESMVEKYGIYEYTPIKINHICSILLYCNYYQLQQMLISTYSRSIKDNENIKDWKLRHAQYANWARYLVETCQIFGKLITEKDIFYYSINSDQIDFGKSLKISYSVPISMTRDIFVAQSYFEFDTDRDNVGMLLSITKQSDAMSFYIDCGWCSDFPQEQEVLVLATYSNQARIQSMVHISFKNNEMLFNNYQFYMSAISDLERMVKGNKASDYIDKNTKIALEEMIRYKFGGVNENHNDNDNDDDEQKEEIKQVKITAAATSNKSKPEFVISISTANEKKSNNDNNNNNNKKKESVKETETKPAVIQKKENDDDKKEEKEEEEKKEDNNKKKVRPKGKLKGQQTPPRRESGKKEVIFKLKAKRKKKVPEYVKNMFDEYCDTVKIVNIDFSRMVSLKGGYRAWRDIFMNADDSWVKIDILVKLFKNLSEIKIHYIPQAFTKQTVKALIEFLKSKCVKGRELEISVFRPETYSDTMFDGDNKDANIADFTLKNALNKYLLKKSKIGNNFNWFCRLNDNGSIPCIEIIRPHKAMERNKDLSSILNENEINIIMELLKKELSQNTDIADTWYLNLLYTASKDGFEANSFHTKCDGIAHTISIIKSTTNSIFGAYTSKPWGRSGKWVEDKYAFIISINNNNDNKLARIINIKSGHEQYGMYLQSKGGPGFGKGDIKILNKADKSSRNTCNSNSFIFNTKPNELVGGNGSYFKVADYEVFQIAFY